MTLLKHWVNAALIPWLVGIDIWPTCHFRKQCNPSSPGLSHTSFELPGSDLVSAISVSGWDHDKVRKEQPGHRGLALVCNSAIFQRRIWATRCTCGLLTWGTSSFYILYWSLLLSLSHVGLPYSLVCARFLLCQYLFSSQSQCALLTSVPLLPVILLQGVPEDGELPPPAFLQSWASCTFFALPLLMGLICGW